VIKKVLVGYQVQAMESKLCFAGNRANRAAYLVNLFFENNRSSVILVLTNSEQITKCSDFFFSKKEARAIYLPFFVTEKGGKHDFQINIYLPFFLHNTN